MRKWRLLLANGVLLLVLLGSLAGRNIESAAATVRPDFLQRLELGFRSWKTSDVPIPANELKLLQPDATLIRRYTAPDGQMAELAVIAGHRKRSVHTPGFCMVGGGWEVVSQRPYEVPLPARTVPAVRAVMAKEGHQALVTYFFTDGDYATRSLPQFQLMQMLKRFRANVPVGALVRIIVPVGRSQVDAERLADDFAKSLLPRVLDGIRRSHVSGTA